MAGYFTINSTPIALEYLQQAVAGIKQKLAGFSKLKITAKFTFSVAITVLSHNALALTTTQGGAIDSITQGTLVFANQRGELSLALPMKTDVNMQVSGWTNRVAVRHQFTNNSTEWVNGQYLFPLPNEAAVDQLKLHIGDRIIEGQIQPKAKAKAIYNQAKSQGKQASLLEQRRANIFTAKVANLAPGQTLVVELTYQETLSYRDGEFSLRFPMVVAPRYAPTAEPVSQPALNSQRTENPQSLAQEIMNRIKPQEVAQYYQLQHDNRHALAEPNSLATESSLLSAKALHQSVSPLVTEGSVRDSNQVSIKVKFDSAMAVEHIVSPYHEVNINMVDDAAALVSLESDAVANRDFVLTWKPVQGNEPLAAVFSQQGKTHQTETQTNQVTEMDKRVSRKAEHYALVMLMPPQAGVEQNSIIARELILVIDTSGSMSGDAIEQAKSAIKHALAGLRPQDSFNILQFNSRVSKWSEHAMPATANNIGSAQNYINHLHADGGTEMSLALDAALKQPQTSDFNHSHTIRQVLFITDGAVANESALFQQIADQLADSRLFTIGIGSAPNAHFMQRAAELGRGTYTYIGKMDEVNHKVVKLLEKIEKPQVTDVDLRFSDGSVPDYWPVNIPDLYADEPVLVAVRIPSYVSNDLMIEGQLAGNFWQRQLALTNSEAAKGLDLVWARKQIAALELTKQSANKARIEKQITAIAMNFHIMSAYTSLVAVDVMPVRPQGLSAIDANVEQHLPHGWHSNLIGLKQTLPQTGTNSYVLLIFGSMLLLLALLYRLSFVRANADE
ncbi:marine proteobacterial sortase target protein [Shewanella fidelis]|uniref:Marine proteobacterial sortase target protein n=1 Tax=Shewanella fidelis TaxID=173509 RepID=A0AAW8NP88_9GAMM|nr:marine proteobacterial sortase target protein [Shewanella fidelis]MDR8524180.1 marine proteobacterial sortase target protein [Shewanella fidelis]MDW4810727.1 marine proteobacterial sortase target protein [Shewanella fidelis]MDW4814848.1 marine proteobacterial sortase target protein [Shewanella fidelis]MDW4818938.1 marine proteobacterial sortase target protein [Shewanella fidelis]MDW4823385.1 marine proteobacterial sortase target protein [Shewanella fidelis]